jgi:DNA-binding response OmpR family regulator
VHWLRLKIEDDPASPKYIQTVRGYGYRFASPEELS